MYDSVNMHKKIKEMTGIRNDTTTNNFINNDGRIVTSMKLVKSTKYNQKLYKGEREELSPPITMTRRNKNKINTEEGKAAGQMRCPSKMMKT